MQGRGLGKRLTHKVFGHTDTDRTAHSEQTEGPAEGGKIVQTFQRGWGPGTVPKKGKK